MAEAVAPSAFDFGPHFLPHALTVPRRARVRKDGYLNLANNEFVHPALEALLAEGLAQVTPETARAYPHHPDLIEDLARHFGLDRSQVLISAGSDDAIKTVTEALFATTGRLILQVPNYEQHYAALRDVEVTPVPVGAEVPHGFTVAQFRRVLDAAPPSSVMISNPNSPVGFGFSLDEVAALAACCAARGHVLVVDEAYVPYGGFDHLALLRSFDNVVLIRSLSKSFGIAGLRAGLVATSAAIADYLARWNMHNPVSGATMVVVRHLLANAARIAAAQAEIVACRGKLVERLRALFPQWSAVPSCANFVNFDTGDPRTPDAVADALRRRKILIRSMSGVPELSTCVRFTIADAATMERVERELELLSRSALSPLPASQEPSAQPRSQG
ncbi:pyridoxal phosphate-dependent aminotransferase [Sorangium sp. So ce1151]|uniref:pyridoxal phosphate-dependent aminotransferase n=1 Tax=Sorangium sp. So ce1151 TaxID=3133332 RepID=UPI003F611203